MHEYLRHQVLERLAGLACHRPRWVVAVAVLLAVGAVALAVTRLGFQPDRNALVSRSVDWNARYLQQRAMFSFDDLTVIVALPESAREAEGTAPAPAVRAFIADLADRLHESPAVAEVFWRIDTQQAGGALARTQARGAFAATLDQLEQMRSLLASPNLVTFLQTLPQRMQAAADGRGANNQSADGDDVADTLQPVIQLTEAMAIALRTGDPEGTDAALQEVVGPRERMLRSDDGRFAFVRIRPNLDRTQLEPASQAVAASRTILAETLADHPQIEAGLTGVPVIEADETRISRSDATWASLLAVAVIAVMLVIAFHSIWLPVLAVASLLVGVAWSFGYLTLAIGHLQLLSVIFTVILLGLGVDFGIHLMTQFESRRDRHPPGVPGFCDTMRETLGTVGPGIITGAVTTAVAFAALTATDFAGMAEMGHIAAVGIMLCLVAMLILLPALMRLVRPRRRHVKALEHREVHLYQHHWFAPFHRHPVWTVIAAGLIGIVGLTFAGSVRYDYNLARLLPAELDSVAWMQRADQQGGLRYAASVVEGGDLAEVRRRARAFAELPTVGRVGGAGLIEPRDDAANRAMIRQFQADHDPPADTSAQPADAESLRQTLTTLTNMIETLGLPRAEADGAAATAAALRVLNDQLRAVREAADALTDDERTRRLAMLNARFDVLRSDLRRLYDQVLQDRPLTLDDLPEPVRRSAVVGPKDAESMLIQIFPAIDVTDVSGMTRFVEDLRRVDPKISGAVVQVYYAGGLMIRSFTIAGLLAALAVFALLYLDLQTFGSTWPRWLLTAGLMAALGGAAGWLIVEPGSTPTWWPIDEQWYAPGIWLGLLMVLLVLLIDPPGAADALLCMLPVGVAFAVVLGVMGALDLAMNPANIMGLPLLFGIGVDAGVHMIHRFRVHPEDDPPGLAGGTGKGIMLTSLTTMLGFGTLMIARHHGIFTLGLTLAAGVLLTLMMCLIVMPALLRFRGRWHQAMTKR